MSSIRLSKKKFMLKWQTNINPSKVMLLVLTLTFLIRIRDSTNFIKRAILHKNTKKRISNCLACVKIWTVAASCCFLSMCPGLAMPGYIFLVSSICFVYFEYILHIWNEINYACDFFPKILDLFGYFIICWLCFIFMFGFEIECNPCVYGICYSMFSTGTDMSGVQWYVLHLPSHIHCSLTEKKNNVHFLSFTVTKPADKKMQHYTLLQI